MKDVEINELYSIDSDSLSQLDPVYGVVFLFKYGKIDREYASNGNRPLDGDYDVDYENKGIFFANQTIQNACATPVSYTHLDVYKRQDIDSLLDMMDSIGKA